MWLGSTFDLEADETPINATAPKGAVCIASGECFPFGLYSVSHLIARANGLLIFVIIVPDVSV